MISSSDIKKYDHWYSTQLFFFCDKLEYKHIFHSELNYGSREYMGDYLKGGWRGYRIGNESSFEYVSIRQWFNKNSHLIPNYNYMSSETSKCYLENHFTNCRFFIFSNPKDYVEFYNMLSKIPPRIHFALAGENIEPRDEFENMIEKLNHSKIPVLGGKQVGKRIGITFSDSPNTDKIKILAAFSLGN